MRGGARRKHKPMKGRAHRDLYCSEHEGRIAPAKIDYQHVRERPEHGAGQSAGKGENADPLSISLRVGGDHDLSLIHI